MTYEQSTALVDKVIETAEQSSKEKMGEVNANFVIGFMKATMVNYLTYGIDSIGYVYKNMNPNYDLSVHKSENVERL